MITVPRRVTQRWTGASSHQFGMSASRMRPYTTPPYMFFDPGNGPRSSRQTLLPSRASTSAAVDPAGPAPTTITSKSGSPGESVSIGSGIGSGIGGILRGAGREPPGQLGHESRRVRDHSEI